MTRVELNYIKDAFSQIIDDIAGNPDWHEAAKAVASDLGTLERKLEEKISPLPSNLDEAAEKWKEEHFRREYYQIPKDAMSRSFKAGAEWMAGQGVISEGEILDVSGKPLIDKVIRTMSIKDMEQCLKDFNKGDKVIVQIRKK